MKGIKRGVRSRRPVVLRRLHAIDARCLRERWTWVVSFSILRPIRTASSDRDAPRRSLSKKPEEAWGGKCSCGSNKVKRFGVKGGPRTACIECKSENMINLTTKICTCGSDRQVRFGRPGGKPEKCSQCKTEGMVDLTKKKDEDPALG